MRRMLLEQPRQHHLGCQLPRQELVRVDVRVPLVRFFGQRLKFHPDVSPKPRREQAQFLGIRPLFADYAQVLAAVLRLPRRLPRDHLPKLRRQIGLDFVRGAARRLGDLGDLAPHSLRMPAEKYRQQHQRQQRRDDEHNRYDRRPRAVGTDAPDASPLNLSFCHQRSASPLRHVRMPPIELFFRRHLRYLRRPFLNRIRGRRFARCVKRIVVPLPDQSFFCFFSHEILLGRKGWCSNMLAFAYPYECTPTIAESSSASGCRARSSARSTARTRSSSTSASSARSSNTTEL